MKHLQPVPILLILGFGAVSTPAIAQGIPDNIPDKPGESLVDRERERMEERYRSTLSRFFTTFSFDMAVTPGPHLHQLATGDGFGYQANVGVGMHLESGDALLLSVGTRVIPAPTSVDATRPAYRDPQWYFGVGYEVSGTRFLGSSPTAQRSALGLGVGVLSAEVSALAFEIAPTYALLQRDAWSFPVGVKLNVATFRSTDLSVTRTFLGVNLGVRWHWMHRDRLE